MEFFEHMPQLSRFAIALMLGLTLPQLAQKFRLPGPIGLIIAGILLGPHGLTIIDPNGPVIVFFAGIGKLLLMFLAGFEIDSNEFSRAYKKSILFGILTFSFPFLIGAIVAYEYGFGLNSAAVVGSILASHTLLALPLIKEAGLMDRPSMLVTVGATVFTDILSILVLAICLPIHMAGFSGTALVTELIELAIYVPLILFGLSWLARSMLRWLGNSRTQRISVLLLLMAIAAQLAEFIQLEGIIGAFLAGIAAKRAFQHTPMEEALDIVSNTLFIPAFFVTAGFLIDFHIFAETLITHPLLVIGIVGGLILGKYLAGRIAGSLLGYQHNDGMLMFAMSVPQVAATLAVALVAYAAVNGSGARLIDEPMLNATIVLVIITSALGLILANRYAKRIVDSNTRVLSNEAESAVPVAAASGELPQ